jgi:5'-nucleotidase
MKVLISNDDGIGASGIEFLKEELEKNHFVTTIAPNAERSSCGHGITLGEPLRVKEISKNTYSCSGYPADCILIGLGHVLKDDKPDVVVSGINHGANLGQDRYYSGTIAAAREATFRGIPAIAVSLVTINPKDIKHFDVAAEFITRLLGLNIHDIIPPMALLNINVPNMPWSKISGVKYTTPGIQKYTEEVIERIDARGGHYYWVGGTYEGYEDIPGSDCFEVANKYITINLQDLSGKEIEDTKTIEVFKDLLNKL